MSTETIYKYIKVFLGEKEAYVSPLHASFANTLDTVAWRGTKLDRIPL